MLPSSDKFVSFIRSDPDYRIEERSTIDTGVDPSNRYGSDNKGGSPSRFAQAEEGDEDDDFNKLFKLGKKKKMNEKSAQEISLLVEQLIAEFELAAEEDAILNIEGKPAINKLRKLPLLTEALSKKQLQHEFLDHGVLILLKTWLEPLPDDSLPSINIREAILRILTDFPLDLEQHDAREQLKRSGLGKVIMFLSRSDEETTANRKLAKDLVDKWSRPIFNKSTRFEDMRNVDDERAPQRRAAVRKVYLWIFPMKMWMNVMKMKIMKMKPMKLRAVILLAVGIDAEALLGFLS